MSTPGDEIIKRRLPVNQLSDICTMWNDGSLGQTIDSIGAEYNLPLIGSVTTADFCGLCPEDFLIFTHNYQPSSEKAQFVTNKITIPDLEYLLYEFRLKALSSDISVRLDLGDLAHKDETELNLQNMSHKPYVLSSDLYRYGASQDELSSLRSLPLEVIDCDWDQLFKKKASVISPELKLKRLAYLDTIDYDPNTYGTSDSIIRNDYFKDGRWPINRIIKDAGDLATKNERQLQLSALSHKDCIYLKSDYGKYINGKLDFSHVDNYEDEVHRLVLKYLPLATTDNVGVVKLNKEGTYPNSKSIENIRKYSVQMENELSTLYVEVPWEDHNTLSTYSLRAEGKNTLVFEGFGVNQSLLYTTNIRRNDKDVKPIFRQVITLNPIIDRNIILSPNVDVTKENKRCLARFSAKDTHLEIEDGPSFEEGKIDEYLSHDGSWQKLPVATDTTPGFMSPQDKQLVNSLKKQQDELGGDLYVLPAATTDKLGGIQTGYQTSLTLGKYAVNVDNNNNAYVYVPNPITTFKSEVTDVADKSVDDKIAKLYPKGSIYITTAEECPLKELIPGSEWTKVSKGRCLWGYDGTTGLGKTIEAGLPSHYHYVTYQVANCGCGKDGGIRSSHSSSNTNQVQTSASQYSAAINNSKTVQPPAYVVNIFQRTK